MPHYESQNSEIAHITEILLQIIKQLKKCSIIQEVILNIQFQVTSTDQVSMVFSNFLTAETL